MGSRRASRRRREHRASSASAHSKLHSRLHSGLFDGKFHVLGSSFRAETPSRLLSLPHLHTRVPDSHHVGNYAKLLRHLHDLNLSQSDLLDLLKTRSISVGIVLDKTRSSSGSSYFGSNVAADFIYATCKIPGSTSSGFLSKSCRWLYVRVYRVRTSK